MGGTALRPDFPYSYRIVTIAPGTYTKREIQISGEKIVYASPTNGGEIGIRLESGDQDAIPLRPNGEIIAPYSKFFVDGTVTLAISLLIAAPGGIQLTGRDVAVSGTVNTIVLSGTIPDIETIYTEQGLYYSHVRSITLSAQLGTFQLKNPTGSGKIIELLRMRLFCATAGMWIWGQQDADIAIGTSDNGDSRNMDVPVISIASVQTLAAASTAIANRENIQVTAGVDRDVPMHLWIPQGRGIGVVSPTLTATVQCTFFWRERAA